MSWCFIECSHYSPIYLSSHFGFLANWRNAIIDPVTADLGAVEATLVQCIRVLSCNPVSVFGSSVNKRFRFPIALPQGESVCVRDKLNSTQLNSTQLNSTHESGTVVVLVTSYKFKNRSGQGDLGARKNSSQIVLDSYSKVVVLL
jgi:hypothetical protein